MIEKMLEKIADSQAFEPDDKLTELVEKYTDDELSEDNLDLVFAARKGDFERFKEKAGLK